MIKIYLIIFFFDKIYFEAFILLFQEINKTSGNGSGSKVDADDTSKYRQLLVRTLHSCCIRFPGKFYPFFSTRKFFLNTFCFLRTLSFYVLINYYILFLLSDVAGSVIPLLMDFLSDAVNDEASALDVLIFTREAMAKFDHLRYGY